MNVILLATAFISLLAPAKAPITINLNIKDGDVLTGDKVLRATVNSQSVVSQVEFYVDTELRDSATSTPYEFHFDTLNETDGPLKLKFKAYNSDSQNAEKVISVVIDNGLSKGAAFHIEKGQNLLTDSKFSDAISEGRIALKIDPKSNPARVILARANLGLFQYDKAQKYADDATQQDPNDVSILSLKAVIDLQRAFRTLAKEGSDSTEILATIKEAQKNAVECSRKALDIEVDKLPAPTPENLISQADTMIRAERYSLAINTLRDAYEADQKNLKVANRLAFAQLRSGRLSDCLITLTKLRKYGQPDAYAYALLAVANTDAGNTEVVDDMMREALLADSENLDVRTAQAYIALKRNQTSVLAKLAVGLAKDEGQRPEVNYFLAAVSNSLLRYSDARKYFERAALAVPANSDIYVEQANTSLGLSQKGKLEQKDLDRLYENAKMMFETALIARPESSEAFSGLTVVNLLQKNPTEAIKNATAAIGANPNDAGAQYAYSAALQAMAAVNRAQASQYLSLAQQANLRAGKLDQKNLQGREIPNAIAVWRYLVGAGRRPVIAAPRD